MWNARDYDPAIKLLENWKPPLLPVFIYDNIIDQLIMPKLTREVNSWNPNSDTQMIHQWLHPWLPLLRERMEPLHLTIRQKFRSSLQRWDPIDTSAFDIIEPWNNVCTRVYSDLIIMNIIINVCILFIRFSSW